MEPLSLFLLAICILFIAVFGEASLSKFAGRETPGWFIDQFKATWLGRFPIRPQFWLIAVLEFLVAALFVAALLTGEPFGVDPPALLGYGLLLAAVVFTMLCFGLRVSCDFAGAASAFTYAALSLLLWSAVHLMV